MTQADGHNMSLEDVIQSGVKLTPMMEQYFSIKKQQKDTLLLYRMGDFYEVFFEDARKTSKLLNIALTHRGKIGDIPIPMAGIPHHAANNYIDKLTQMGIKVAICEQVEDPKEAKGIVKRAVTQIVSPGLPYDLDKATSKSHHFVASGFYYNNLFLLVLMDFTTGEFRGHLLANPEDFVEEISKAAPKEFILFPKQWNDFPLIKEAIDSSNFLKTSLAPEYFDSEFTTTYINKFIPNAARDKTLKQHQAIFHPIGALSYYIYSTQGDQDFSHIRPFQLANNLDYMKITVKTLRGLEILPSPYGNYKDSVLGFFDKTKSSAGSRKLKDFFLRPTTVEQVITERQRLIQFFLQHRSTHQTVRSLLDSVRDIERILAKTATQKANGSDLLNIAKAYQIYLEMLELGHQEITQIDPLKKSDHAHLHDLSQEIIKTVNDEIGASLEKGNLIKEGANKKRDKLAKLSINSSDALKDLEKQYRESTGIPNLKIKSNNVAGYFIEVSKSHTQKVPSHFVRRQTLVNSERYMTEELDAFEKEIFSAKMKLEALEREIFKDLMNKVKEQQALFLKLSDSLSYLDILQSLAYVAEQEGFVCPQIEDKNSCIEYKDGWHPIIKTTLKDFFVPHHLTLNDENYFALITGPNMAGKTTVMRSAAIIQFLAQLGSFVPALSAKLGICDYIFSRLGASDDILKGQSTFMVEMSETAEIIRHATKNSLIVLDEIGRGTSTYDGISLAWSLVEYFVKKTQAKTLFATHYHELIELIEELPHAKNLTVATEVKETAEGMEVQFLYNLIEQAANQSYGIYVAKLAGLPKSILKRSEIILHKLEKLHQKKKLPSHQEQLTIFTANESSSVTKTKEENSTSKVEEQLKKININEITPLQALEELNKLQRLSLNQQK